MAVPVEEQEVAEEEEDGGWLPAVMEEEQEMEEVQVHIELALDTMEEEWHVEPLVQLMGGAQVYVVLVMEVVMAMMDAEQKIDLLKLEGQQTVVEDALEDKDIAPI